MSEAKTKKEKPILLDGAMGTLLQDAGMPLGARPEVYGMEHPELVEEIHRQYLEAGSRVLYANTFGANARKLRGSGHTTQEVVAANVAAARRAAEAWSAAQLAGVRPERIRVEHTAPGLQILPMNLFYQLRVFHAEHLRPRAKRHPRVLQQGTHGTVQEDWGTRRAGSALRRIFHFLFFCLRFTHRQFPFSYRSNPKTDYTPHIRVSAVPAARPRSP